MNSRPRKINPRWLSQRKSFLDHTARTLRDGSENPVYVTTKAEYECVKSELDKWRKFEKDVKVKLGYILNNFTFRGEPPGSVFIHKENNKWMMLTFDEAWEKLQ